MNSKHTIQVREKGEYGDPGKVIATIKRVLIAEQIGNFNPIFCQYKGKKCLVNSLAGDLSDPFRRNENYLKTLYLEEDKMKRIILTAVCITILMAAIACLAAMPFMVMLAVLLN